MRSVIQGLDIADSWQRYLQMEGEHRDARVVRKTIAWIRDEFAAAARRHQRHGVARLITIDVARTPDTLSLEDFIAENGLDGFSEAEQLEAYQLRFGRRSNARTRRARLIARQLAALHWLEELEAEPPAPGDSVSSWLHPDLAGRLERSGLTTLAELATRINGLGKNWSRAIPAIGAGKAERIVDWMRQHQDSVGIPIGSHVSHPRRTLSAAALAEVVPMATAVVPIDKFVAPPELDGSRGAYRGPVTQCRLEAGNDAEAILAWLYSKRSLTPMQKAAMKTRRGIDPAVPEKPLDWLRHLSHTQRAYLKEAERFLLWAVVERRKPLSSMDIEDCQTYLAFLANPTPAERWCAPRSRERWSPLWRPFEGPVSPPGQRQAIKILNSLHVFLAGHGYLRHNPWAQVTAPKAAPEAASRSTFTPEQWRFIDARLAALPPTSAGRRLRLALHLLHATGLPLSELVRLKTEDLHPLPSPSSFAPDIDNGENWEIRMSNMGRRRGSIRVLDTLVSDISRYLASRGLPSDPRDPRNQEAYLLGKATDVVSRAPWAAAAKGMLDPKEGIAASTLAKEVKAFFKKCASQMKTIDRESAEHLAGASTNWLRQNRSSVDFSGGERLEQAGLKRN